MILRILQVIGTEILQPKYPLCKSVHERGGKEEGEVT